MLFDSFYPRWPWVHSGEFRAALDQLKLVELWDLLLIICEREDECHPLSMDRWFRRRLILGHAFETSARVSAELTLEEPAEARWHRKHRRGRSAV